MTARTWIGGGNNKASNAHDWSPTGAPAPGDTLSIGGGTMDIRGFVLGSPNIGGLNVTGTTTFNVTNALIGSEIEINGSYTDQTQVDINIRGIAGLRFATNPGPGDNATATVHLVGNSVWIGSFSAGSHFGDGGVTVTGGPRATFINVGTSIAQYTGGSSDVEVDVAGTGRFEVTAGATLEFGKSVGAGQTVEVKRTATSGTLKIDRPSEFRGLVQLDDAGGAIDLVGLAKADSYTYQNDMLSIYAGKHVIDTLRLAATSAFSVEKTSTGVTIYNTFPGPDPGATLLPAHS
jgi:hypothetical protein